MSCKTANAESAPAKIPKLAISPFVFALIGLYGFSGTAHGQNSSLQIRLEKALENARAITNVEIQYDDVLWIKGMPDAPLPFNKGFTRTEHITYIAADGKYRSECRFESPDTTNIIKSVQTTFDGKLWSEFNGSTASMVQQDGDMPGDQNSQFCPLILPFLFLSRQSDQHSACGLRFTDRRDADILNGLILPESKLSNGVLHLSFPGLPQNGVNRLWSIAIDDAGPDFKPSSISQTVYAGGKLPYDVETTCTFSDYTNLGAYHFPTKMGYACFNVPANRLLTPTLALTGMVTVVSVKIPMQIPDSTFRQDESKALRIWNTGETKGFGVGLILGQAGSNIVVKRIILDSPAGTQNEIHPGDRILSIAESNALATPVHAGAADLPRAVALLQGTKGSTVELIVIPSGKKDSQAQAVTLVRGEVRTRIGGGQLLTNGLKAPDIEMVVLTNRAAEHLSDYAGKIVVLEFWASWCSPCRNSMADLQLDFVRYPSWKDKVVLISASIDDTADIAAQFILAKGWNETHNVWLNEKNFQSYHVGGIPFAYVIDAKGTIATSGEVGEHLNIAGIVNQQLAAAGKE